MAPRGRYGVPKQQAAANVTLLENLILNKSPVLVKQLRNPDRENRTRGYLPPECQRSNWPKESPGFGPPVAEPVGWA